MTAALEKIVRPVQLPAVLGRRIPSTRQGQKEKLTLRIGRQGTGKVFNGSFSQTVTFYCEAHQNEARQL